jgi:TIR domain/PASTA domain
MNGIFISYRRDDAPGYAGRLYDRLAAHFGADHVFMDVQGIEPGVDFVDAIEHALASCKIVIVLIGKDWLAADNTGRRRLDDPSDFVRIETATALARGIRVVPVLVEGAEMPRGDSLPTELVPLVRRQAVELSHKQWDATSAELIRTLEKILDRDKARAAGAPLADRPRLDAQASSPGPLPEAQPVAERRPARLYWVLGAALLLIAASVLLYATHPWRRNIPAASPPVFFVAPDRLEFAEQALQVAAPASAVTITNRGGTTLHVSSIRLEGPAAADFTVSENQCSRGELAPGASCAMKVVFRPQAAGSRTATLSVAHDAANAAAAISMQGRGAEPIVAHVTPPAEKPGPPATTPAIPPPERKPEVVPAPPKILRFDARLVDDKVQLCYGVENAASATITPEPGAVKPLAQECVFVAGDVRKTYTLSARSASGVVATRAIGVEAAPRPPSAQLAVVPNEIGKSRRDASAELEKAGFKVQVVESKPDAKASGPGDSVVAQSPKGGEQLAVGDRVTIEIMAAPATTATLSTGFPRVGDSWQYDYKSMWKNVEPRTFVHQLTAVSDGEVRETMSFVGNGGKISDSKSFRADSRFVEWRGQGYYFVEFNPFLQTFGALQPGTTWKSLATPIEDPFFSDWYSQGRVVGSESVSVPAGTFTALRVELNSNRNASSSSAAQTAPARIRYVIWYSPDVKRTVKHVRTVFRADGTKIADDTYELVKYVVH